MNANRKNILISIFLMCSFFVFSQERKDVYFILDENDTMYFITGQFNLNRKFITIYDREQYEYHQKKVKEAKAQGTYEWDPDSGRDNLDVHVSKLIFKVLSKKEIELDDYDIHTLKLVDYKWLNTEGWKQINGKELETGKPLSFKDIYFLYKIDKNKYISYKVGVTITSH